MTPTIAPAPTRLSPELLKRITPLQAGEKATYELIPFGEPVTPLDQNDRPLPQRQQITNSLMLPGTYPVFDAYANGGDGQEVVMTHSRGTSMIDVAGGGKSVIPNVLPVEFKAISGGRVIVDAASKRLYEWLEFHPDNADTVGDQKSSEPKFRRVQPTKAAEKRVNLDDRITEARIAVRSANSKDKQFMAELLGLPTDLDSNDDKATDFGLTALLNNVANSQPDAILTANRSEAARASQLVRDLDTTGQAKFDPEKGMWLMASGQPLGGAVQVPGNASQELAKWFQFSPTGQAMADTLRAAVQTIKDKDAKRK